MSPLLAQIVLPEVLEAWCERAVTPRLQGRGVLLRFAAAFGSGGAREDAARRMLAVLPKRVTRFGLTSHPQQTGLVDCRKPARRGAAGSGNGPGECLGFPQDWTTSRRGDWGITRVTAKRRLRRAMTAVWPWGRNPRHDPLGEQHRKLSRRRRGQSQDDGIRGHYGPFDALDAWADQAWRDGLSRRRQQRVIPWAKGYRRRTLDPLPHPSIVPRS